MKMRLFLKFDKLLILVLCFFSIALIMNLIHKSSHDYKLAIQLTHYVNSSQHLFKSDSHFNNFNNTKWKVLNDGTVIHLGNYYSSFNYSYIINNENICNQFHTNSLKVIVFIDSEAINFERRQLIRETWGLKLLQEAVNFRIVFLLALSKQSDKSNEIQDKIQNENVLFGDVIQFGFVESFKNLTLKSILSLGWYLRYCSSADFAFKTDDDIYIHVPNLLTSLKQFKNSNNSIICHENKTRKIIRSYERVSQIMKYYRKSSKRRQIVKDLKKKIFKYIVSFSQMPGLYYPSYCAGFGYGFSLQVAQRLYRAALSIPYFSIEDVFITGFCRQKANVDLTDNKLLNLKPVLSPKQGICAFNSGRINANEMSIQEIRELWTNINTQGFFCPKLVNHSVNSL